VASERRAPTRVVCREAQHESLQPQPFFFPSSQPRGRSSPAKPFLLPSLKPGGVPPENVGPDAGPANPKGPHATATTSCRGDVCQAESHAEKDNTHEQVIYASVSLFFLDSAADPINAWKCDRFQSYAPPSHNRRIKKCASGVARTAGFIEIADNFLDSVFSAVLTGSVALRPGNFELSCSSQWTWPAPSAAGPLQINRGTCLPIVASRQQQSNRSRRAR
jgi:hypothetical protein